MIIYEGVGFYAEFFLCFEREINLWKIEKTIDRESSFIVPSYPFIQTYREKLKKIDESSSVFGVQAKNTGLVHSLVLWKMAPKTIKLAPKVVDFLNMKHLEVIDTKVFMKFPSQSFYVDIGFSDYAGIIFCKDYVDSGSGKDFIINITLMAKQGFVGQQITYVVPRGGNKINLLKIFDAEYQGDVLINVFCILLYVLHQFDIKSDYRFSNNIHYLGYDFSDKFEATKGLNGYWKKGYWNTYYINGENGNSIPLLRWIQPVWVNG